jgi:hypothetical protein
MGSISMEGGINDFCGGYSNVEHKEAGSRPHVVSVTSYTRSAAIEMMGKWAYNQKKMFEVET